LSRLFKLLVFVLNNLLQMDTINRLLKKQTPKRRSRITGPESGPGDATPDALADFPKADPAMIRWVSSSRDSCRIGVPEDMFGGPAARLFGDLPARKGNRTRKLVEEV
jgi:Ino eighty subunit 2